MRIYRDLIFPWVLDWVMSRPEMMRQRERALADVSGEVLEVGFGTGLNLAIYPPTVTQLRALDPVSMLRRRVARRIEAARMPVEFDELEAERLPYDDARFDSVVSTWTLCTIPDVAIALGEVRRVLRPGGRFFFLEHGRSGDAGVARWQDRLNPLQRIVGVGCNLNRPIDSLISAAGLDITRLERFQMPHTPRVAAEHYLGEAQPS